MSRAPAFVLVAHGTRSTRGVDMIAAIADRVRERVGLVRVAFVDVLGPSPSEVLADLDRPAVVVPAFLASGYHVHSDVPREIEASGHREVAVTQPLGPDPTLAAIVHARLVDAGWRPGDAVVLAAAGSSDPRARDDVRRSAAMLATCTGTPVRIGYVATGGPKVPDVVADLRAAGHRRVFIASYLLAHGLFQQRLHAAGTDGVGAPIGDHPGVVELLVRRYHTARHLAPVGASHP
ncbi:MAG TPA: sirohydrochlorin chelatase [Aldersonia sp.]